MFGMGSYSTRRGFDGGLVKKQSATNKSKKALPKTMKFEGLSLEVAAKNAGLLVVKPPVLRGKSGVDHRFDVLVSDGPRFYGFDLYQSIDEMDVLRSYIKKFDTNAVVGLVCATGKVVLAAGVLAKEYDMQILPPDRLSSFFSREPVRPTGSGHRILA